ncbi:MAG: Ig-like domain-containing protein, partial [Gemmatimonadales bacterium]
MSRRRSAVVATIPVVSTMLFVSCGGDQNSPTGPVDKSNTAVVRIDVTPGSFTVTGIGVTKQFQAQARDANGRAVSVTITWSTSDSTVATIDATGMATSTGVGVATIMATASGVHGTASLTVNEPP